MWDGRLDNRDELRAEIRLTSSSNVTDVSIVVAIYEQQGVKSFARLAGDWALSIWDPTNCSPTPGKGLHGSATTLLFRWHFHRQVEHRTRPLGLTRGPALLSE